MTFFFFGTLRDQGLLESVLGRTSTHLTKTDGWIDGFATRRAKDETFPVLIEEDGARLSGIVVEGLSDNDMARIRFFEDTFYEASSVTVETNEGHKLAQMFLVTDPTQATDDVWSFESWSERDRAILRHMAVAFVSLYGIKTYEEADEEWEAMRERAVRAVDDNLVSQRSEVA